MIGIVSLLVQWIALNSYFWNRNHGGISSNQLISDSIYSQSFPYEHHYQENDKNRFYSPLKSYRSTNFPATQDFTRNSNGDKSFKTHWELLSMLEKLSHEEIEEFLPQLCIIAIERTSFDPYHDRLYDRFEDVLLEICTKNLNFGTRLIGILSVRIFKSMHLLTISFIVFVSSNSFL